MLPYIYSHTIQATKQDVEYYAIIWQTSLTAVSRTLTYIMIKSSHLGFICNNQNNLRAAWLIAWMQEMVELMLLESIMCYLRHSFEALVYKASVHGCNDPAVWKYGKLGIFHTVTCNPNREIKSELYPARHPRSFRSHHSSLWKGAQKEVDEKWHPWCSSKKGVCN